MPVHTDALKAMRKEALLVNLARGKVVDEAALITALRDGEIGGAALDTFVEEPLPENSPLWALPNTIITPHCAGDTQHYERNVIDILVQNIRNLESGTALVNQIV